jgi:hypothetical protein
MLAHGFTVAQMVDLCVAGLAIATPERMIAGRRAHKSRLLACGSRRRGGGRWRAVKGRASRCETRFYGADATRQGFGGSRQ